MKFGVWSERQTLEHITDYIHKVNIEMSKIFAKHGNVAKIIELEIREVGGVG